MDITEFADTHDVLIHREETTKDWFQYKGVYFKLLGGCLVTETLPDGSTCLTNPINTELRGRTIPAGLIRFSSMYDARKGTQDSFKLYLTNQVIGLLQTEESDLSEALGQYLNIGLDISGPAGTYKLFGGTNNQANAHIATVQFDDNIDPVARHKLIWLVTNTLSDKVLELRNQCQPVTKTK